MMQMFLLQSYINPGQKYFRYVQIYPLQHLE